MFKPRVYKPQFSGSTPILFSQLKRKNHKLHVHTNDWLSSGLLKLLTGGVYIPGLFAWTKVEISTLLSIIWNMCSILSNLCTLSTICREEFQQSYSACLTTECKQCMPLMAQSGGECKKVLNTFHVACFNSCSRCSDSGGGTKKNKQEENNGVMG